MNRKSWYFPDFDAKPKWIYQDNQTYYNTNNYITKPHSY